MGAMGSACPMCADNENETPDVHIGNGYVPICNEQTGEWAWVAPQFCSNKKKAVVRPHDAPKPPTPKGITVHTRFHGMHLSDWLKNKEANHLALKTSMAHVLTFVSVDDMGPVTEVEGSVVASFFVKTERHKGDIYAEVMSAGKDLFKGSDLDGNDFETVVKDAGAVITEEEIQQLKQITNSRRAEAAAEEAARVEAARVEAARIVAEEAAKMKVAEEAAREEAAKLKAAEKAATLKALHTRTRELAEAAKLKAEEEEAARVEAARKAAEEAKHHAHARTITYYIRQHIIVNRMRKMRTLVMERVVKLRALTVKANKELAGSAKNVELDLGKKKVILKKHVLFQSKTTRIKKTKSNLKFCKEIAKVLRTVAEVIKKDGAAMDVEQIKYEVSGHTYKQPGKTGREDGVIEVSYQRAHAVMVFLTKNGVKAETLFAHGYGGTRSLGGTMAADRRVEIRVVGKAREAFLRQAADERDEDDLGW